MSKDEQETPRREFGEPNLERQIRTLTQQLATTTSELAAARGERDEARAGIQRCCADVRELLQLPEKDVPEIGLLAEIAEKWAEILFSREHTQQWYAVRFERLRDLFKDKYPDVWHDVAAIVANSTLDTHEPPTYSQQLNMMRHRAEKAERELTAERQSHAATKAQLDEAQKKADDELSNWLRLVRKAAGLEAYIVPATGLLDELRGLRADLEEARASVEAMRQRLLDTADRYMREDGTPGDLSSVWGWRDISKHLRDAALSTPAAPRVQGVDG